MSGRTREGRRRRYALVARGYDVLSLEWPVYGPPRRAGLGWLAVAAHEHVLDVGVGTGLNLPALAPAVGERGLVTGVDASAQMLARAQARVDRHGWGGRVRLVQGDAGEPGAPWAERPADAVVFTYALSVIPGWRQAFATAVASARPGARLLVVDMALPVGRAAWARPFARLACQGGGADVHREPWGIVADHAEVLRHGAFRGGHVHVVLARLPG